MSFSVIGSSNGLGKKYLEEVAEATFSYLDRFDSEIELKFITESEIRSLNNIYRKIDNETDVLSFKISENPLIGQIFICYNIAKAQAKTANKSIKDEVSLLLVHGILHIFDFDHISTKEEKEMQNMETEILSKVGVKR